MRRPVRRVLLVGALIVFAQMAIRTLFDTFAPPVTYGARSAVSTYVAAVTYFALGFLGAWIVGRARAGVALTAASHIAGHLLSATFTFVLFLTVIEPDLKRAREFEMTGGFDEVLFLPLLILPVVIVLAAAGALIGKGAIALRLKLRSA
jgi:hypothetical protein